MRYWWFKNPFAVDFVKPGAAKRRQLQFATGLAWLSGAQRAARGALPSLKNLSADSGEFPRTLS
jgi:hypothetical protein